MKFLIGNCFVCDPNYLEHFGIKGQKWGIRRYQNPDGTLTAEGKQRYGFTQKNEYGTLDSINKLDKKMLNPHEALYGKNEEQKRKNRERSIKCADVGLKALSKMKSSMINPDEDLKKYREWFLFEDQTIGLPQIADLMVNQ